MTQKPLHVDIPVTHFAKDCDAENPVSWAVYSTQHLGHSDEFYSFAFTRIDSDQWSRVTGELTRFDKWEEGDSDDKDEWPVVLTVATEPDTVEDGFVTIAHWLKELMLWHDAL